MPVRTYRWLLLSLAGVGLAADQASKYVVFGWLYHDARPADEGKFQAWVWADSWRADEPPHYVHGGRYNLIPGWFGVLADYDGSAPRDGFVGKLQTVSAPQMPHVNKGALFGLGGTWAAGNVGFTVVSLLAAGGILVWGTRRDTARERWLSGALGLILAGCLGNLYDRVVFHGVRDFLYFHYIKWPVFNIADCCLVVGAALLILNALFVTPPDAPAGSPPAAAGGR